MTGIETFGNACGIEASADHVDESHGNKPRHGTHAERFVVADRDEVVHSGHDTDAAESDKHAGAHHSEFGLAESIPKRYDNAHDTACQHRDQIDEFCYGFAVEGVVEPWNERGHY